MQNNMFDTLSRVVADSRMYCKEGVVAGYIPELARMNGDTLGVTVHAINEHPITAGDCGEIFTMQSISKVFSLLLALIDHGEQKVFQKVGMEPTGEDYNSMLKLELIQPGTPFNPMINAGAIVISSMIMGDSPEQRFDRILQLIRKLCQDESLDYNHTVYRSEFATSHRNRSLAYFLKDNHVLEGDVDEHLSVYIKHCAIEVTCSHIAAMGMVLANQGVHPDSGEQLIPKRYVQIAKTFMVTCGMYNASGEFAIKVGIPAKSGVSGGILGVVPGRMGIGVIGPALDEKGNSVAGVELLRRLSEEWRLSLFIG